MQMANMLESPLAMSLERGKVPYVAFDLHPSRLRPAREAGFNVFYGDASRPAVSPALHSMPLSLCSILLDSALDWPVMMCSAVMASACPVQVLEAAGITDPVALAVAYTARARRCVCALNLPHSMLLRSALPLVFASDSGAELASSTVPLLLYS